MKNLYALTYKTVTDKSTAFAKDLHFVLNFLKYWIFRDILKKGVFTLFSSYMYLSAERSSLSTTIEFLQQQQGA